MGTDIGPLYLLYNGISCDGTGNPVYIGRTQSIQEAEEHFKKCKKNPYSIGKVEIVTDSAIWQVTRIGDLHNK